MNKAQDSVASALVHPLVVMNISEHWTRIKVQNGSPQPVEIVIFSLHYLTTFLGFWHSLG